MTETALVSIIMPAYNRAHLIGESIQSVINQTYTNWELIVVDDGSTDGTPSLIKNLSDTRIKYIRIEHSGAFGVVRNHGIRNSHGEYIAFLDSDDLWDHTKLQKQLALFNESPDSMFIFTHIDLFGKNSHRVKDYKSIITENLLERYFEEGHFTFYPSSIVFRKSVLPTTGFMNETLSNGADTEFFARLCLHFKGSFLGERLVHIRKHAENTSARELLFGYPENLSIVTSLYRQGHLRHRLYAKVIGKLHYKMGLLLIRDAQYHYSLKCFLFHCRIRPFHWKGWVRLIQASWLSLTSKLKGT